MTDILPYLAMLTHKGGTQRETQKKEDSSETKTITINNRFPTRHKSITRLFIIISNFYRFATSQLQMNRRLLLDYL